VSVWPEERLRAQVEAAGGEQAVAVQSLLRAFGLSRLTELGRRDLDRWLKDAGLEADPPLARADGAVEVTLRVPGHVRPIPEVPARPVAKPGGQGTRPRRKTSPSAKRSVGTSRRSRAGTAKKATGTGRSAGRARKPAAKASKPAAEAGKQSPRAGKTAARASKSSARAGRPSAPAAKQSPPAGKPAPRAGKAARRPDAQQRPRSTPERRAGEAQGKQGPQRRPPDRPRVPAAQLAAAERARRRRRRRLNWYTAGMVVLGAGGVGLLAEGLITVAWKEPFSALNTAREQRHLQRELNDLRDRRLALIAGRQLRTKGVRIRRLQRQQRMFIFARALHSVVQTGNAVGEISIPRLGLKKVFVEGADNVTIRKGPGHYGSTLLPGQGGTVGIAGHRTTYGAPFRHLDELAKGNRIILTMPYGRFMYRVTGIRIYPAGETDVFRHRAGRERLVVSACHPVHSDAQRIVVFARLRGARPLGPAAQVVGARPVQGRDLGRRLLRSGVQGRDVAALQRLLGVPADGVFGPGTEAAVKSFQTVNRLRATGVVGPRTRVLLIRRGRAARRDASLVSNLPPTPPLPPPEPRPDQRDRNGQNGQQEGGQSG
jgi:sortase A